jgi:hypothetical protein
MRAQRLPASAGLRWIGEAFVIFRAAPLRQMILSLSFLIALTLALWVPGIGFALVWLLIPALMVGPHAVARMASQGVPPDARLLTAGFRRNFAGQLRLGAVYLAGMMAILAATMPADGGQFARAMVGVAALSVEQLQRPELQSAMLIGAGLQSVMLAALWYAPLLVAWRDLATFKALFFSVAASLINWRPFLAYGAGMLLLFAFVLMLALAGAALFDGSREQQANAATFAVVWTLLPVWFGSSYLSYRDVFGIDDAAAGPAAKSPTIAP